MKFSKLAQYFEKIESTQSRLEITYQLAELFSHLSSEEIDKAVYLLQGRVCPTFEKIEFGIAERMVIKAAMSALNVDRKLFEDRYKKLGDLGKTVEEFKREIQSIEEKDLSVLEVYDALYKLATAGGAGSQDVKINTLAHLIRQLDSVSAKYIVRIPQGVMRLGFSDMTILDALSWMIKKDKSLRPAIETAYHVRPDLGFIAKTVKADGVEAMKKIKPRLFTPIIMMRAERLANPEEIIKKIGIGNVEPKYDGFRLQIHAKNNKVEMYSRNLEEVSFMYPDITEGIKKELKGEEVILEGEAVGFNPITKDFLPFQETVQRKRKYDIAEKAKSIPLKLFVFELLYLNGKSYINEPYKTRRDTLAKAIHLSKKIADDTLLMAAEKIIDNAKEMELEFDDAISKGLEGIVVKKLDGIYQPGARGMNWIKFKRSYSSKIEDTIDCLIMGYDFGKGKRAGFGIGAFLVGVYDEKEDKFVTVAKIGTGLSDDEWRTLQEKCQKFKSATKPALYEVDKMMGVNEWVKPEMVVEIKADEITKSTVHTAGRVMKVSKSGKGQEVDRPGYALRFPRLVKFRNDKRPEEVTALKEIDQMFKDSKK